ncbi:MAG: hypothetical protein K8R36_15000 [Planctomycetales bacterium]|nr:hypothetical protein [Planctomycetales bacterium]
MMNLEQGKNVVAVGTSHELVISGDSLPPGAEKPRPLFSESGAPVPAVGAEKPGGFFSGPPASGSLPLPARAEESEPREEVLFEIPPAPWSRGGRPSVLTPEVREQVFKLLAVGMSRRQAGAYLDIDPTTITHAAKRDPEFARNLKRAEELGSARPLMTLMAVSRRNWRAAAWLVKHRKEVPETLTPEEQEERHQERLRATRRSAELTSLHLQLHEEEGEKRDELKKERERLRREKRDARQNPRRR